MLTEGDVPEMAYMSKKAARAKSRRAKKRGKSGIVIRPQNKGKLRKTAGTKKGKKIPVAKLRQMKRSKNPKTRRRATFALNARKWKH